MADTRRTTLWLRDSRDCCGGFAGGSCEVCERPQPYDGWRCSCGAEWVHGGRPWHREGCDAPRETSTP